MKLLPKYEDMIEKIYSAVLCDGDIAVDIGAHIGRHAIPMAEAVGARGSVFAFEPLPSIFESLEQRCTHERLGRSELGQIKCFRTALGETTGNTDFVSVPDFPEYSGFAERQYHSDDVRTEVINVPVSTLDSYIHQIGKTRFIKIDAEGGELAVLRGAVQTINTSRPIVSFELGDNSLVNYPYSSADYFDFFESKGYSVYSVFGVELKRQQFLSASEQQWFWDYLAVPNEDGWSFDQEHLRLLVDQLASC